MAKPWGNVFGAAAVVLLGMLVFLVLKGWDGQTITLIAAALCLLGSRFADVITLKLSPTGIHAEMQRALDDAKATVSQLHILAEEQARLVLQIVQGGGRWGGQSRAQNEALKRRMFDGLRRIGIEEDRLDRISEAEYPFIRFDYASDVTRGLAPSDEHQKKKWNEFFNADRRKGIGYEPSPSELEDFLNQIGLVTEDVKERLEDYKYYDAEKSHRRRDVWLSR
ncbi:hypothetical protein [Allomesorhizobium camelthorni]|uniref:Uncharacterized protein n=1 Tax=Allomesorhizobium camelthorni TaxID=475069 RepID=A0A6G4WBQ2_9HYPH|nr:hypothetical protein [Mesorhizobium camelthorni]NGO51633.1 hypothetical protein [Mesorhizobium camelthorni]